MSMLRLFYALWPDSETRDALCQWQGLISGRKIPRQNLHLTLHFLGKQPEERLPLLREILHDIPGSAMQLDFDCWGYFSRNKISWAGITNPPPGLFKLQAHLADKLKPFSSASPPDKPFRPHLTLAYRSNRPETAVLRPIIWHAKQLVLVESRLPGHSHGSVMYRIVEARLLN